MAEKIYLELTNESDRACAILCAAFLDHELQILLRHFMRDVKESAALFQQMQPLATFSARIILSYALGLIPTDIYHDLNVVRKIRNDFAHDRAPKTFAETTIASKCHSLVLPRILDRTIDEPRKRFEAATEVALGGLFVCREKAYIQKRGSWEETPVEATHLSFRSDDIDISTWFDGNKRLANVTLHYVGSSPITIVWDNPETLSSLADQLHTLAAWMKPSDG